MRKHLNAISVTSSFGGQLDNLRGALEGSWSGNQSLLRTLLPLTEPRVEDMLRLRPEAYGRINGPPHVPPPMAPPSQEDEAAARAAMATHGQYDARLVWTASLALSRQRLTGGGKGCSMGSVDGGATEMDDLSNSWFGGRLDADGGRPRAGQPRINPTI